MALIMWNFEVQSLHGHPTGAKTNYYFLVKVYGLVTVQSGT